MRQVGEPFVTRAWRSPPQLCRGRRPVGARLRGGDAEARRAGRWGFTSEPRAVPGGAKADLVLWSFRRRGDGWEAGFREPRGDPEAQVWRVAFL